MPWISWIVLRFGFVVRICLGVCVCNGGFGFVMLSGFGMGSVVVVNRFG